MSCDTGVCAKVLTNLSIAFDRLKDDLLTANQFDLKLEIFDEIKENLSHFFERNALPNIISYEFTKYWT